jgi:ribosomal protein S12 methylthiotransferase accessory factor
VDDPGCLAVLGKLHRAGVAAAVWETTSDVGIPSFHCSIVERSAHPLRPVPPGVGSGCHPCREVALLRALTEAAQTRLTQISGARDELSRVDLEGARDAGVIAAARAEACAAGPGRRFQDVPTCSTGSLDEDVAWELERLRAAGIEQVAVVDLTKPEIGVPVVRVVIPGLEALHEAPGYVPGPRARAASEAGAS